MRVDCNYQAFVDGMRFAQRPPMILFSCRILQITSVLVLLAAEVVLSIILVWLIRGHGVIACGKGLFNNPSWPFYVVAFVATPAVVAAGAGLLFLWCSNKIDLAVH